MIMSMKLIFSLLIFSAFINTNALFAQSLRYMDEGGNIHFVDSIYQVPPKYRNQVLAPTAVPTGKARPTPRPTRTPRPTKIPNSKTKKSETKSAKPPTNPLFSNFPTETPVAEERQASPTKSKGLRSPPLPILNAPPPNLGIPQGVLADGVKSSEQN